MNGVSVGRPATDNLIIPEKTETFQIPANNSSCPSRSTNPTTSCRGWSGRPALSIGKSAHGTSLFASKNITAGDCILKVPYSVQLAPDDLVPELKDLLSDGVGDAAKLATVVLFEQRMGNDSGWAPYIRWLPRPEGCIER
ncbi:hypothetical protein ACFX11_001225 [Malus domestica]